MVEKLPLINNVASEDLTYLKQFGSMQSTLITGVNEAPTQVPTNSNTLVDNVSTPTFNPTDLNSPEARAAIKNETNRLYVSGAIQPIRTSNSIENEMGPPPEMANQTPTAEFIDPDPAPEQVPVVPAYNGSEHGYDDVQPQHSQHPSTIMGSRITQVSANPYDGNTTTSPAAEDPISTEPPEPPPRCSTRNRTTVKRLNSSSKGKSYDYSHLQFNCMTQLSMRRGLNVWGSKGESAVFAELQQLHLRKYFQTSQSKISITIAKQANIGVAPIFKGKKRFNHQRLFSSWR